MLISGYWMEMGLESISAWFTICTTCLPSSKDSFTGLCWETWNYLRVRKFSLSVKNLHLPSKCNWESWILGWLLRFRLPFEQSPPVHITSPKVSWVLILGVPPNKPTISVDQLPNPFQTSSSWPEYDYRTVIHVALRSEHSYSTRLMQLSLAQGSSPR